MKGVDYARFGKVATRACYSDCIEGKKNDFFQGKYDVPDISYFLLSFQHKGKSMKQRFIKFIPSDFSDWLRSKFPSAFLLLSLIAQRARRDNDSLDGFLAGDALLGDHEEAGLTRKQYRTALIKLQDLNVIEILKKSKNGVTCQKRAIKRAIKGTLVNLKDSSIWDINSETEGHQHGQQGAIKGPSKGHEQEGIRKNKNIKKDNTPPTPKDSGPADAGCVRVFESQEVAEEKAKKPKSPKSKLKEISQAAKDFLPKFIDVIKRFKPTYVVKSEENILEAIDGMLRDGRSEDEILRVLGWAVRDNTIRGNWDGWSSKVICKNPAAYLANRFDQIDAASKSKVERRFASFSDDEESIKKLQMLTLDAL